MSSGDASSGTSLGKVFHPEASPGATATFNGGGQPAGRVQFPALPRRRRPGMIALGGALLCAGILVSVFLYRSVNHQVPVVIVTANVPAGDVITAGDLGTATVAAGPGLHLIPAGQIGQAAGHVAATALRPGMLLVPSELTTAMPPASGQVLVPVPIRPADLPASGLSAGDHVLLIATPGAAGQSASSSSAAAVLTGPVQGMVEAVSTTPGPDGFDRVDLLLPRALGPAVAKQASTGQVALLITSRNP